MTQRVSPQLLAAAAIVVVALGVCWSSLFSGAGDYQVLVTNPRVGGQNASLLSAGAATDAMVPPFAHLPDGNPFTLRKHSVVRGPRIGLPPPPPLSPPSPPVLPLPENQ